MHNVRWVTKDVAASLTWRWLVEGRLAANFTDVAKGNLFGRWPGTGSIVMKLWVSFLLLSLSLSGWADGPLSSQMETFLVTKKNGKEVVVATQQASPGDVVEYRLTYSNESDQPLSGLVITGPVPANTEYLKESAAADVKAEFTVSIDGGETYQSEPVKRTQTDSKGQSKEIIVPAGEYTQLRWVPEKGLQPGKVQTYRYRVKVQ